MDVDEKKTCSYCGSEKTVLGFYEDLYRKCLSCGEGWLLLEPDESN